MKFTAEQIAGILEGEVIGIPWQKFLDCQKLKKVQMAHLLFYQTLNT
jgi:hypothetical protein